MGDIAAASLFVLDLDKETYDAHTEPMLSHINVGTGTDVSILELAQMVAQVTGFEGRIETDPSKPDGTMRKLMDVSRLTEMGWTASIGLEEGIADAHRWFMENRENLRGWGRAVLCPQFDAQFAMEEGPQQLSSGLKLMAFFIQVPEKYRPLAARLAKLCKNTGLRGAERRGSGLR